MNPSENATKLENEIRELLMKAFDLFFREETEIRRRQHAIRTAVLHEGYTPILSEQSEDVRKQIKQLDVDRQAINDLLGTWRDVFHA